MKKNDYKGLFCPLGRIKKWLWIMKLMAFFFFLGMFQVHASAYAQNEMVTLDVNRMTVEKVFKTITQQLSYDIFYSNDELDTRCQVTLSTRKMSVQDLLEEVLKGNYSYEFVGKTIIIRPVKQSDKKIVIQGTVKDQQGGSLPGVTVLVKGSTIGVSTDGNGKFRLEVASADSLVLVFSFVGMETKEVAYWGETELNVVMKEKDAKLDEVVVTGYQQIEKRQLTSAVSSVKTEDLNMIGATSIEQMLQGQLAGISVVH